MRFTATNFFNSLFVFLAMSLATSRVRASFYIAENPGNGNVAATYYAVPAASWNCYGIEKLNGEFTHVSYSGWAPADLVINFQVASGLCGYEYAIVGYMYTLQKWEIYTYDVYGQKIGTCVRSVNSFNCSSGIPGVEAYAYCTEDSVCD
jgi:hypothetical protein